MLVKDWMTELIVSVTPEDSLLHARTLMERHHVRHLPVVREGQLEGIVTDRDVRDYMPSLCRTIGAYELRHVLDTLPVDEVMTRHPVVVAPGADVREAASILEERGFNALPVMDDGRLVGIFTSADALRALAREEM